MSKKPIILYNNEYCHVTDNESGEIELVEGPLRFLMPPHKSLFASKQKKLVLKEGQYIVINNPYSEKEKKIIYGRKTVLKGPMTRSLYPGEHLEGGTIYKATILQENQGAVVLALCDFKDENGKERKAGEKWIIRGPCMYIPDKHERFVDVIDSVQVSQNESVYVRNTLTSELKLVSGPISYMPGVFEELYAKELSADEYDALSIPATASTTAFQVQIQKAEAVCVIDYKTNTEKYIIGPNGYQLGPEEGIKVLNTSGGVPKKENKVKLGVVRLGPDFMSDSFNVRTKDNAVLNLLVSYKWNFIVDDRELFKIFHGDFVGYSCQSMRSRVREEVSHHDFEQFHADSSGILRKAFFKNYEKEIMENGGKVMKKFYGRFFPEYNFLIFQLDVKKIQPVDKEIGKLLDESIKSSMNVLVKKQKEQAEAEQKKREIVNKVEIEKMKTSLVKLDNENFKKKTVERAKIEGRAQVESAKAKMKAQTLLQNSKLELEINNLKEKMDLLKGKSGDIYINYIASQNLGKSVKEMTVVPKDTKTLFLNGNQAYMN